MKKSLYLLCVATMAIGLVACGSNKETVGTGNSTETVVSSEEMSTDTTQGTTEVITETAEVLETIQITSLNANKEKVEITVPYDPQRIAILDLAALDIIDNLGMGERVVGSANTSIEYLKSYAEGDNIAKLGTIKEADLEAVMACEPDVIFIGGRLSASYDALSEIAPVVFLATDTEIGLVESVNHNAKTIASMFGLENEIDEKMASFEDRIAALQEIANGKTALVGMTTSGSFNLLGNDGRCSIIGVEVGFDNLTSTETKTEAKPETKTEEKSEEKSEASGKKEGSESGSPHGNESSFEVVVAENPDYIFVMDRDSAIGTDGAQLAKEIMENELVMGTDAYKNERIIYLEHPSVWYTAEGGISALDMMLQDLESSLLTE